MRARFQGTIPGARAPGIVPSDLRKCHAEFPLDLAAWRILLQIPNPSTHAVAMLEEKKCKGCGTDFRPNNPARMFHSRTCVNQSYKARAKKERHAETGRRIDAALAEYTAAILKAKPTDAVGYRLHSKELDLFLPILNAVRRNGLRVKKSCLGLDPVEIPISPLEAEYLLSWVFPSGVALPSNPPVNVAVRWADDCSKKKILGVRLVAYRAAKKVEKLLASAKVMQQADAQNRAIAQASAASRLPTGQGNQGK